MGRVPATGFGCSSTRVNPDADVPRGFRYGRLIVREERPGTATYLHKRTGKTETVEFVRSAPVAAAAADFGLPEVHAAVVGVLGGGDADLQLLR